MMRRTLPTLALTLLLAALPVCRKDKAATAPRAHVPGTPHTDEVLNAWHTAGLAPEGFAFAPPPLNTATYCERGMVRGVDTTVCEYADDQALERGVQQVRDGWNRMDVHTGVVLRAKRTTMVVVDRERREPSGKTISQMTKIFGKL